MYTKVHVYVCAGNKHIATAIYAIEEHRYYNYCTNTKGLFTCYDRESLGMA